MDHALSCAKKILEKAHSPVCFSGAGLSAESGISTFRDTETHALWGRFNPTELASPEGFAAHPKRVLDWYAWRRQCVIKATPNQAHISLAKRSDIQQITQNVDDLLERAGCKNVTHLHGTLTHDRCHNGCGYRSESPMDNPLSDLQLCPNCGGQMRPDVVWFGEMLPTLAWEQAYSLCNQSDCLLVIGTSANVYPAASLIELTASQGKAVIIINTHPNQASHLAEIELIGPCGELLPQLLD